MSRYAVTSACDLIVSWQTDSADRALVLTRLSTNADESAAALAAALTALSAQLWRTYTHPASAVPNEGDNSEHWRREQERSSVDTVLDIIPFPNVPDEQGNVLSSYDPVVETANEVGRALLKLGDAALTRRVRDDITDEIDALQRADSATSMAAPRRQCR